MEEVGREIRTVEENMVVCRFAQRTFAGRSFAVLSAIF